MYPSLQWLVIQIFPNNNAKMRCSTILEGKYACTFLSVTGHLLKGVEGCYIKVIRKTVPVSLCCKTWGHTIVSCIMHMHTLLTTAAGSRKKWCPIQWQLPTNDDCGNSWCYRKYILPHLQTVWETRRKRITGTPQKQPLTKFHSFWIISWKEALHLLQVARMQELLTVAPPESPTGNKFSCWKPLYISPSMFSITIQDSVFQLWCPDCPIP